MLHQSTAVLGTASRPVTESSETTGGPIHSKGLARKLTCSVVSVVFTGVLIILFLQVGLILSASPGWESDTKKRMIDLEQENLVKIASDKAEYVTEIFGRLQEGILQVQAFAEQVLLDVPETMIIDNYVKTYPGLDQEEDTYEHSVWFIPTLVEGEYPPENSTLEQLVNRSSLMDVPFRSMQQQNKLMYLAALDEPSNTASDINMQSYTARNTEFYLNFTSENTCDDRYEVSEYPDDYDPRCRPWYQDAIEDGNTGVIFTNPYTDAETSLLTITVATPVYESTASMLVGVVGIDVDLSDIEDSINNLTIIGEDPDNEDNGYAYLLAPGDQGEVAVHRDLDSYEDGQFIIKLEEGIDKEEFKSIINQTSAECNGWANYSKNGDNWFLAWEHETVSVSADVEDGDCNGFTVVVTVSESALLQEFSHVGKEVRRIVAIASVVMAVVLVVICLFTVAFAVMVSNGIVKPVNQLIDVVHSLYTMNFSKHQVGTWMVNEVSSPEVEELIEAFKAMSTVVKAANMNLRSGNLSVARENYVNALILFKKLEDDRGVAIANNNLGTVHTLQAQEIEMSAISVETHDPVEASRLNAEARGLYSNAITNYKQAIDDAAMLCAAIVKNDDNSSSLLLNSRVGNRAAQGEMKELETIDATYEDEFGDAAALFLQLSNRKFNLAMCNASRGYAVAPGGGVRDPEEIDRARDLLHECIKLAGKSKDDKGDVCKVRYLLELANLESRMQRQIQAGEALDAAEQILALRHGDTNNGYAPWTGQKEGSPRFLLVVGLPQRLLAARGLHSKASGDPVTAIACWTRAIIGSGDKMDVGAVEASLKGLRDLVSSSEHGGIQLPSKLLVALGLPSNVVNDKSHLLLVIDDALAKVEKTRDRMVKNRRGVYSEKTSVDLCFIMDCTGSMQSWIDQAKTKLMDIINQAKADVGDLNLRVGFVGYRDFGDRPQYEGPYNFHSEEQLPELITNLKRIKAFGGTDFPEDMAGGLNLAANEVSWKSHVRLCILIADAPCHGNMYHSGLGDRFPDGDKNGLDPTKLLYDLKAPTHVKGCLLEIGTHFTTGVLPKRSSSDPLITIILKYKHGVDLYFIKITDFTDKMMRVFQTRLANMQLENKSRVKTARSSTDPEIKVHDLGSDDNRFLEAVVESVKSSVQRSPLLLEE